MYGRRNMNARVDKGRHYRCLECGELDVPIEVDGTMSVDVESSEYDIHSGYIMISVNDVSDVYSQEVEQYYCSSCGHGDEDLFEVIEYVEE
ncbi:MAG: hypothetical protein ACRDD8_16175 [Bacteroidales bacterium]